MGLTLALLCPGAPQPAPGPKAAKAPHVVLGCSQNRTDERSRAAHVIPRTHSRSARVERLPQLTSCSELRMWRCGPATSGCPLGLVEGEGEGDPSLNSN